MGKKIIGALDIGSSKVTAVIASHEEGQTPVVIGLASVPSKGIKKGLVVNIDDAVNTIAQALNAAERMADVTLGSVFVSVSGKSIISKNNKGIIAITHDEITQDDVLRAIEAAKTIIVPQGYEILHIVVRDCTIDAQNGIKEPIGMSGSRLEIDCHIVLAPTSITRNLAKCVQKLAISVDAFVFAGWADSYSVPTDTEKDLGVTLIDIGASTTDIVVFQDGGVVFSGSVPLGGTNITRDITSVLNLPFFDEAEKILMNYKEIMDLEPVTEKKEGKTKKEKVEEPNDEVDVSQFGIKKIEKVSKSLLENIVKARIDEILEFANDEIKRANLTMKMPAGIILVGGTAKLPKITVMIKETTGIVARVGNPHGLEGMTEEISGPEYATVQGLILYAVNNPLDVNSGVSSGEGPLKGIFGKVQSFIKSLFP